MELHQGRPKNADPKFSKSVGSIEEHFSRALEYAGTYHKETLQHFRDVSRDDVTPRYFWSEYIWAVYTSGFNAKVVTKVFDRLINAYGPYDIGWQFPFVWSRVKPIFANERKCKAICTTRNLIRDLTWDKFAETYLDSPDSLQKLPFVGGVTKYHIARNLGFECVKPDLHLVRLADHFDFDDPESMCSYLSALSEERIGVVDFVLWSFAAAFGTKDLE